MCTMKYKIRLIFSHPKDTDSDTFAHSTLEITYEPFKEEYDALIRPEEWPDEDAHGGIRHRVTLYGESIEKVEWIEFNRATEKFLKKSENCRCFGRKC